MVLTYQSLPMIDMSCVRSLTPLRNLRLRRAVEVDADVKSRESPAAVSQLAAPDM